MKKRIFWIQDDDLDEAGNTSVHVQIELDDVRGSITCFYNLARELQKTFPQAKEDYILARRVYTACNIHHSMVVWNTHLPKGDYPGWSQLTVQSTSDRIIT